MKFSAKLFLIFSIAFSSLVMTAQAREGQVSSLLYNCNMSFNATGESIALGIGYTHIHGKGEINCFDLLTGVNQRIPISVEGKGPSLGLKISGFNISGGATGIGLSKGPKSLLGSYAGVRGSAAVIKGVGATVALRLTGENITINLALNNESGLGVGLDGLVIDIREDGSQESAPAPVATQNVQNSGMQQVPVTVQTLTVSEGQPVIIKDSNGQVQYIIYLKAAR